ncbi:MAG: hypothetical protein QOH81_624 [Sphingomonadales bacterium]|jgi:FkbM family methyltransferase|nr:hypothetical protein [Sphingomonadales bacterium]
MDVRSLLRAPRSALSDLAIPLLERGTGFAGSVAAFIAAARKNRIAEPVIDRERFPKGQPTRYSPIEAHRVLAFLKQHADDVNRVAGLLADDYSRDLLRKLLAYRALGPGHVTLPKPELADAYAAVGQAGPSPHRFPPFEMGHYAMGGIEVDCWRMNAVALFIERQYFFRRGNTVIQPELGDVVIDAGACFGDTALAFAEAVAPNGAVYSFEPVPRQIEVFRTNMAANPALAERVRHVPFAVADQSGQRLMFSDGGAGAAMSAAGTVPVETLTIDDLVSRESLDRVDYIKMDVEGAETVALKGATETIRRFKPKLGISIYHSLGDLISLPLLVHRIEASYELFLDHHRVHAEETVLYGVAEY